VVVGNIVVELFEHILKIITLLTEIQTELICLIGKQKA